MATRDGWIPFAEKKPEEWGKYLVYAPSADPDRPFISLAFFDPEEGSSWLRIHPYWASAVTHWMPLPGPPGEENPAERTG